MTCPMCTLDYLSSKFQNFVQFYSVEAYSYNQIIDIMISHLRNQISWDERARRMWTLFDLPQYAVKRGQDPQFPTDNQENYVVPIEEFGMFMRCCIGIDAFISQQPERVHDNAWIPEGLDRLQRRPKRVSEPLLWSKDEEEILRRLMQEV